VPVAILVTFPSGFVAMGYASCITAGVTSCVTRVIVNVNVLVDLHTTYRTLSPMLRGVLIPGSFVGVSDGASISTGVTSRIASVIIFVI
jgi:hypothetical protein